MTLRTAPHAELTDDQLWRRSVDGDQAAFGRIVERYQALICSLALSASGSLARSEDLAQETFITAWRQLGELREPSKLRAWLCGIVRTLAANAARREQRRSALAPTRSASDEATFTAGDVVGSTREPGDDLPAAGTDPVHEAISAEEATLLWRTLEQLPETYREPLVLFYRQGQSVTEVAASLDVSEDSIKQRLSRGRAMLRNEVTAVIERTLTRSAPSAAFTVGVLAALPAVSPPHASAAVLASVATGQGAAGLKAVLAGIGKWTFLGPAIGLAIGLLSTHAAASTGRSEQERTAIRRHARKAVLFCWLMSIGLAAVLSQAGTLYVPSALAVIGGVLLWVVALVGAIMWSSKRMEQEVARIRRATGTDSAADAAGTGMAGYIAGYGPLKYRTRASLFGLPLIDVAIGGNDPGVTLTRRALGWFAFGDVAVSPLFAFGGIAAAPIALGGVTLGIISFSLWGLAAGVLAFGSVAAGYWAYGFGALGWEGAAGGAAVAKDYAIGALANASQANTPAAEAWFADQWFHVPVVLWAVNSVWLIALIVVLALGRVLLHAYRQRQQRQGRTGDQQ